MERVPQLVRRGKKDRRMGAPSELDWEDVAAHGGRGSDGGRRTRLGSGIADASVERADARRPR